MKPRSKTPEAAPIPPLRHGDHLTQVEFHRRYEAYPEDVKFELIGGIVFMSSPLKILHGTYHLELGLVFTLYKADTPGVQAADNATAILGEKSEVQPDLMMWLLKECGGRSDYNKDGYLLGAPELVAEIAGSSRVVDLGRKRKDYLAAGVQEYIVLCIEECEVHWFHFPSKRKLKPDRNGVWKSRIFPGLWINEAALWEHDSVRLLETVRQGVAAPEHEEFARRLRERR
jgi:hypothetical protein